MTNTIDAPTLVRLREILTNLSGDAPAPDLSFVELTPSPLPRLEDLEEPWPFALACVKDSPDLITITQEAVDSLWEREQRYVEQNHDDPTVPCVFYACRAIAQGIDGDAEWLQYVFPHSPVRANEALEILIKAVDAIPHFQKTMGTPEDYEGCCAYHIQGLLWIAKDIIYWNPIAALALLQRTATLIPTLKIKSNRLSITRDCLYYLMQLEATVK
jgi:hypothetical protein